MYSMKQRTTIQIEHTTLEKLKELKIARRESYDEIVNRLIKRGDANERVESRGVRNEASMAEDQEVI